MVLLGQKCCLLSAGVSAEGPERASVLRMGQGFLATRDMTRINVGLARSYVKLLLSSWKTFTCNLMAWCIGGWWGFLWAPIVLHLWQIYFCIVTRGTLCLTFKGRNVLTSWMCSAVPLGVLTIFSPSITLNLRNIFLIYIQLNFSWIEQILQTKRLLSWIWIWKLLVVTFVPAFATNAMTSVFLSSVSRGWVVASLDSCRAVFAFHGWLDLLGVALAFWISILKISKLLQNCLHRVIDVAGFGRHLESSFDHALSFCRGLVMIRSRGVCQGESLTRSSTVIWFTS